MDKIAVFKKKEIRKTAYWRKLKQRLIEEGSQVVTFCHGLKLEAPDGKLRETDCANDRLTCVLRVWHNTDISL
jgi:hypothetical protein